MTNKEIKIEELTEEEKENIKQFLNVIIEFIENQKENHQIIYGAQKTTN